MRYLTLTASAAAIAIVSATGAFAQGVPEKMPFDIPYGTPVTYDTAAKLVNAAAAEFLVAAVTVEDAVQHLDEATAALYPYDEIDSLLERAPFYNNPPVDSPEGYVTYQEWIDTWQEIKGSA